MDRLSVAISVLAALGLAAAGPSGSRPAWPMQISLSGTQPVRDFTPHLAEPALRDLLRQVEGTQPPGAQAAAPLDRKTLLGNPNELRGALLSLEGQFWESRLIVLEDAQQQTRPVWSILAVDRHTKDPVQILTLHEPAPMGRLALIRGVGYFYKVRQEAAAAPGPTGQHAAVQVPVLAGWVWLEPPVGRSAPEAWLIMLLLVGATLVVFLIVARTTRRRRDWRSRTRLGGSGGWRDRRRQMRQGREAGQEPSLPSQ